MKPIVFLLCLLILSCTTRNKKEQEEYKPDPENVKEIKQLEDEGTVMDSIYHSDIVGWTITIPKGWKITSREAVDANFVKGMDLMENYLETEIDVSDLKHLLNFHKDQFTKFEATAELFSEEEAGQTYKEHNKMLQAMVHDALVDQGIPLDTSSTTVMIDGLEFYVFNTSIINPIENKEIAFMQMYSRLINGYDFGITISSNNDEYREILLNAIQSSKFEFR